MMISCGCSGFASCHCVCQNVSGLPSTAFAPLPSSPAVSSLSALMNLSVTLFVEAGCAAIAAGAWLVVASSAFAEGVTKAAAAVAMIREKIVFFIDFEFVSETIPFAQSFAPNSFPAQHLLAIHHPPCTPSGLWLMNESLRHSSRRKNIPIQLFAGISSPTGAARRPGVALAQRRRRHHPQSLPPPALRNGCLIKGA